MSSSLFLRFSLFTSVLLLQILEKSNLLPMRSKSGFCSFLTVYLFSCGGNFFIEWNTQQKDKNIHIYETGIFFVDIN